MHLWTYTIMPGENLTKTTVDEKDPLVIWLLNSKQKPMQHTKWCKKMFAYEELGQTRKKMLADFSELLDMIVTLFVFWFRDFYIAMLATGVCCEVSRCLQLCTCQFIFKFSCPCC